MLRRFALRVGSVAASAAVATAISFSQWRQRAAEELERGAEVVETGRGPIEVARFGSAGPMLLLLHGRVTAPTLVLQGTADVNVPFAMGEMVAQRVPGAKLVAFPGADHFMVVSHVDEVFGAMLDFLTEVRGAGPPQ